MSIAELLAKAEGEPAPDRGAWAKYLPVIRALHKKGLSVWLAVKWLVDQGEIASDKQRNAYHSLLASIRRTTSK